MPVFLHRQTRKGRNVIFSIHQPRYSIFKLFGSLTLLSQGEMAYHGACSDVLPYFEKMGKHNFVLINNCMSVTKLVSIYFACESQLGNQLKQGTYKSDDFADVFYRHRTFFLLDYSQTSI